MKQIIAAFATALLLCSPAAFAQGVVVPPDNSPPQAGGAVAPAQTQADIDTLKNMTPDERQQLFQAGVSQVQNLTPDQLKQLRARFDSMTPDEKAQLQAQVIQMLQASPQLKAEAQQKLESLTPQQQQQLGGVAGQQ